MTLTGACPSRRFTGMSRAIPGPLRAKGTSPLGTPGRRRRAVNGGTITRLQLAIAPPALAPAPFDGSPGSPSLRLRSPVPLHSGRFGLRFSGHARYVFRATEYLARPKPGCANRSEVAPAGPMQRPCRALHWPRDMESALVPSAVYTLTSQLPRGPHGKLDPPCREPHDPPGRAVDGVAEPRAVDLPRLAEGL